jgi:spore coat polysaccharide biosynthesis predicted glycosyltransferase SpsG
MAQLMAESDLAIGGAGATAWERCCLGLPTAMIVLAENQAYAAKKLERAQAVRIVRSGQELRDSLTLVISEIVDTPPLMKQLGDAAALVTDGGGCNRVAESVLGGIGNDG